MPLPPLQSSDRLGRGVYSRNRAKRWAKGKKDHQTFLESANEDNISVDRLGHIADEKMAEIQQIVARLRSASGFYGWAVVSVDKATRSGRTVRPEPIYRLEFTNEYHAVIELNLPVGQERRDQQKQHATELMAAAAWKPWQSATEAS